MDILLNRTYNTDSYKKFLRNNVLHLLLCTLFWWLIYDLIEALFLGNGFNALFTFERLLFIKPSPMSHTWFMPILLGFYLFLPVIANGLQMIGSRRIIFLFFLILLLYEYLVPFISIVFKVDIASQVSSGFAGGYYGLYFLFGYLVRQNKRKFSHKLPLLFGALLFIGITVYYQIYISNIMSGLFKVWYDSFPLFVSAAFLFVFFSELELSALPSIFKTESYYSFAIYLIHNPFLQILLVTCLPYFNSLLGYYFPYYMMIFMTVSVLILSNVFSAIFAKSRILKYLCYLK